MSRELEKGLYDRLAGQSPLPTSAGTRVHPYFPQGVVFPAIRYRRLSANRQHSLDGEVGVNDALVQIDCMASSYDEAKILADEVRVALHGYVGIWGALVCRLCSLESETDLDYRDGDEHDFWVSQRYRIYTNMA